MRKKEYFKLFFIILLSTIFIYGVSNLDAYFLTEEEGKFSEGTYIGNIDITGFSQAEMEQKLVDEIMKWRSSDPIVFGYQDRIVTLDKELILFDVKETIRSIVDGNATGIIVSVDNAVISETLINQLDKETVNTIKISELGQEILGYAADLSLIPEIRLESFLMVQDQVSDEPEVVSEVVLNVSTESQALTQIVNQLDGMSVNPKSTLSLCAALEDFNTNSDLVNRISSAIYQAVLQTNFEIIERHTGNELISEDTLGFQAIVTSKDKDLIFYNPNDDSYKVQLTIDQTKLTIAVIGKPFPSRYEVIGKDKKIIQPRTIIHYSSEGKAGQEKVLQQGKNGYVVKVYKQVYNQQNLVKEMLVSKDYYAPINKIVEVYRK